MSTTLRPFPGVRWGDYPELAEPARGADDAPRRTARARCPDESRLLRVRAHVNAWQALSQDAFVARRQRVVDDVMRYGLDTGRSDACCAYVVEAARRALGMAAYDVQILAALHMFDEQLVEMATGEGKSLTVAIAASMAALVGIPVHVLTANDYLVERDAAAFTPLFAMLGLDVAAVCATHAPDTRRAAYARAVVYATAKEVAFDYLRDRLMHGTGRPALQQRVSDLVPGAQPQRLLRGLCMAIVDEADSILIDEARTPLVLSREATDTAGRAFLWQAWALSGRLDENTDYVVFPGERKVLLRDAGRARVAEFAHHLQPVWKNARHRESSIVSALVARHVLKRDQDYVVTPDADDPRDGRIDVIDATTGRVAIGRQWSDGLHALLAIKEGLRPPADLETLARITFQRFFRRYHRLGGISGTLHEARAELKRIYGLATVPIATRLPSARATWPTRVFADDTARWEAVVMRARALAHQGRPVLIGTESVEASAELSARLRAARIEHALLNARFDADEAAIIARAGEAGRITVSTHMAGRGTDIVPDATALRAGGLHVIGCQWNASHRLDRQLAGRAARQGQPGSAETWLSLDAPRLRSGVARLLARIARLFMRRDRVALPPRWLDIALRATQWADETRHGRERARLLREDCAADRALSFTDRR